MDFLAQIDAVGAGAVTGATGAATPGETESTSLRFISDWSPFVALAFAVVLAVVAWLLYYRESRSRPGVLAWLLPSLRALAIFLVALVLAGPVMHHERTIRQLGRLFVLVDGSGSMELDDRAMPTSRKASLLAAVGKLQAVPVLSNAATALEALEGARIEDVEHQDQGRFDREVVAVMEGIEAAANPVQQVCSSKLPYEGDLSKRGDELAHYYKDQVLNPLASFKRELAKDRSYKIRGSWVLEMSRRVEKAVEELEFIRDGYTEHLVRAPGTRGEEFRKAIAEFDESTRWQRLQTALLGSSDEGGNAEDGDDAKTGALLSQLAEEQDVELIILGETDPEIAWWQRRAGASKSGEIPQQFQQVPDARSTNLASGLRDAVAAGGELPERSAVILFTDGRHNQPGSPEAVAREFGEIGIPMFTVGLGSTRPPLDLAVSQVEAPDSVFFEDRARGSVVVADHLPSGGRQKLEIRAGEEVLWTKEFEADGSGDRKFSFDFPISSLLSEELKSAGQNVPLSLQVTLSAAFTEPSELDPTSFVMEETITANNQRDFFLQAVTRQRKVLIIDASPRWETRYLKNLFDRDDQWEATVTMGAVDPESGERATDLLPENRDGWLGYDIIIIGDLPTDYLTAEEQEWVGDFVGKRGGGLVFLDGKMNHLSGYRENGLGQLMPVTWSASATDILPTGLRLTAVGAPVGALQLATGETANAEVWGEFRPPRWISQVDALPSAETVVEADLEGGGILPVMVRHRYGAGQVLYVGTDELWRWRYRAGDTYHRRFWMQVASWIGEPPFAASGERISMASDQLVYDEGDSAALRVRIRDENGNPIDGARATALITLKGEEIAQVRLEADPNGVGLYRGVTSPMRGGEYQISVEAEGIPPEELKLSYRVEAPPDLELDALSMDRGLLTAMASATPGGKFLLEDEMGELPSLFRAIDRKETITSETQLWSTWWWFIPVIALLAVEWFLRKRGGFV